MSLFMSIVKIAKPFINSLSVETSLVTVLGSQLIATGVDFILCDNVQNTPHSLS